MSCFEKPIYIGIFVFYVFILKDSWLLILKGLFVFFENLVYNEIAIYISASVKS